MNLYMKVRNYKLISQREAHHLCKVTYSERGSNRTFQLVMKSSPSFYESIVLMRMWLTSQLNMLKWHHYWIISNRAYLSCKRKKVFNLTQIVVTMKGRTT